MCKITLFQISDKPKETAYDVHPLDGKSIQQMKNIFSIPIVVPTISTNTKNVTTFNTPIKVSSKGTTAPTKPPLITTQRTTITTMTTNRPLPDLVTWSHTGMSKLS